MQIKGDMVLKVVEKGVHKDISIKEGEVRHFSCFGLIVGGCVFVLSRSRTLSASGTGRNVCKLAFCFWNQLTIIVTLP